METLPENTLLSIDSQTTTPVHSPGLPPPVGVLPILGRLDNEFTVPSRIPQTELRLSDRGFLQQGADLQYWQPRLRSGPRITRSIMDSGDLAGLLMKNVGDVLISDPEGAMDMEISQLWDAAPLTFERTDGAAKRTIYTGYVASIAFMEEGWSLAFRSPLSLINKPWVPDTFKGTGAAEGNQAVRGVNKQRVIGTCLSVPVIMIHNADLVYHVSDRPCQSITVFEGGIQLKAAAPADYPTTQALIYATTGIVGSGADIEIGEYATCLAEGTFRLGATPGATEASSVSVVADVQSQLPAGKSFLNIPDIVQRISQAMDETNTVVLPDPIADYDFEAGVALTADTGNVFQLCGEMMASIGGWLQADSLGRIVFDLLAPPKADADAVLRTRDTSYVSAERTPPPTWQRTLTYARNWYVMNESEFLGAVSDEERERRSVDGQTVESRNESLRLQLPNTRSVRQFSPLHKREDASQGLARLVALFGLLPRRRYTVGVPDHVGEFSVGQTIELYHDRWFTSGQNMLCLGVDDDFENRMTELTLWY